MYTKHLYYKKRMHNPKYAVYNSSNQNQILDKKNKVCGPIQYHFLVFELH